MKLLNQDKFQSKDQLNSMIIMEIERMGECIL